MLRLGKQYEWYPKWSSYSAMQGGTKSRIHSLLRPCIEPPVSDAIKGSKVMKSCLDTAYKITKLIKYSPRREAIFHALKNELSPSTCGIRVLCPTRWTVRAESLASILSNYSVLHATWDDCIAVCRDTELVA